jgi:hypothetical protein
MQQKQPARVLEGRNKPSLCHNLHKILIALVAIETQLLPVRGPHNCAGLAQQQRC